MYICEIYQSVQGEGFLTGTESVFVRTSGCNLRCWYCDTPYASWKPEGQQLSVDAIVQQVLEYPCKHVVITGGEPMLAKDLSALTSSLSKNGQHITIETAGTVWQTVHCDLMSISPKLSNSTPNLERAGKWRDRHEKTRHQPEVIRRLIRVGTYQIKFVVDVPSDLKEICTYLEEFPEIESDRVMLMPQGTEQVELDKKISWIEPLCREHGFVPCPRKHIEWFGSKRGT